MKSAKQKQVSSKTVQLFLPQTSTKSSKDISIKTQKAALKKPLDRPSLSKSNLNQQAEAQTMLASTDEIAIEEVTFQQEKLNESKENKFFEEELLKQKIHFLEQQLDEASQKLKFQEQSYDTIIRTYQDQEKHSQSLIHNGLNMDRNIIIEDQSEKHGNSQLLKQLTDLKERLKESEGKKEELNNKVQMIEEEYGKTLSDQKIKIKEQKLAVEELRLKLKHCENRISQKDEHYQRVIDDNYSKHELEIENIKKLNQVEAERYSEKNEGSLQQIKDLHEIQIREYEQKITELKSKIRIQDLQLMEMHSQAKDQVSNNMEVLETIHLRYLDEIKNLNINLSSFRIEKENEVKSLQEKLKSAEKKYHCKDQEYTVLSDRFEKKQKEYESRIESSRKKFDELYKQLIEHEKCEITIQAQRKRMIELKNQIQQLEYKEKWNWKALVKKRGDIENEKVELRKKITSQHRVTKTKITSTTRANDELEKKINVMSVELESAEFQKQMLKNKVSELSKELQVIKKDNVHNLSQSQRFQMTRSVSPKTAADVKYALRVGDRARTNNILNKTTTNIGKLLKRLGSPKYNENQNGQSTHRLISPRDFIHTHKSKKQDIQISTVESNNDQDNFSREDECQLPSPICNSNKQQQESQNLPQTCQQVKQSRNIQQVKKQDDYNEEDINSFLASPKVDMLSFFNVNNNHQDNNSKNGDSSSMITRETRSKATSQYDVRCKICSKLYESVDQFLRHQSKCTGQIEVTYEEDDFTDLSDKLQTSSNISPEVRKIEKFNPKQQKLQSSQNNSDVKFYPYGMPTLNRLTKVGSSKNLSTPKRSRQNGQLIAATSSLKSRNNEKIKQSSSGDTLQQINTANFPNNNLRHNTAENNSYPLTLDQIEDPQIINTSSKDTKSLVQVLRESGFHQENIRNLNQSIHNKERDSLIQPSFLSQSQNIQSHFMNQSTTTTRANTEIEKENEKLMIELKQAKIELALCQERSAANELQLKKELLTFQYQFNTLMGHSQETMTPEMHSNSFSRAPQPSFHSNFNNTSPNLQTQGLDHPFIGANINISTTNVTCFNIGCSDIKNSNEFAFNRGKANQFSRYDPKGSKNMATTQSLFVPPRTTPIKDASLKEANETDLQQIHHMRSPSENVESPVAFKNHDNNATADAQSLNKYVRINRSPNLLLRKFN